MTEAWDGKTAGNPGLHLNSSEVLPVTESAFFFFVLCCILICVLAKRDER